jgi:hypothetical protein
MKNQIIKILIKRILFAALLCIFSVNNLSAQTSCNVRNNGFLGRYSLHLELNFNYHLRFINRNIQQMNILSVRHNRIVVKTLKKIQNTEIKYQVNFKTQILTYPIYKKTNFCKFKNRGMESGDEI